MNRQKLTPYWEKEPQGFCPVMNEACSKECALNCGERCGIFSGEKRILTEGKRCPYTKGLCRTDCMFYYQSNCFRVVL